jgi:acyl carrier protein
MTDQPLTDPQTDQLTDPLTDPQWLRMRIAELAAAQPPAALETTPLRDLGLQSVDFVVLLAEIEQRLGVLLDDDDLDDENFVDVPALDRLLSRVRGRHG